MKHPNHIGLDAAAVEAARHDHGSNELPLRRPPGFISQFLTNLGDPMIKVLLTALVLDLLLSFGDGNFYEAVGITAAIAISTLVSTLSEYGGSLAFAKLSEEASRISCRVIRSGMTEVIPIGDIVVGDLVRLEAGDMIPSDGLIVGGDMTVDQAALTGESREKHKKPTEKAASRIVWDTSDPSLLFRGSVVTSGEGIMRTERVGSLTFLGGMAKELGEKAPDSPLKLRLTRLAKQLSIIGYIAALTVAAADLVNAFVLGGLHQPTLTAFLAEVMHAVTLGITVVVMAVPEGLPMMITVVLCANMFRMKRDHVMVKKPVGIETAGSMNLLFCDKTGTLTTGRLSVCGICTADGVMRKTLAELEAGARLIFELSLRLNTSSEAGRGGTVSGGNTTDRALLEFAQKTEPSEEYRHYRRERLFPFDSTNKYSAANVRGKRSLALIKGAPEKLLSACTAYLAEDGSTRPLDAAAGGRISSLLKSHTQAACRVLAVCMLDGRFDGGRLSRLTFVGFIILRDELRRSARSSVAALKRAGIRTVMITGDNRETAAAIAHEVGILDTPTSVGIITSDELRELDDDALKNALPTISVVARALPSDKSRLVRAARESGLVCGMTGDGVNDAPALQRADVGFAMGSGTAVAKEAGDIVITDDNIASIVKAVLYGRTVFKSIRRFIVFQLTMNLSAVGVSVICPFICGVDAPVTVMQMLWINIIMDTLAGLAFAGEIPSEEYLLEKPLEKTEPVLCREMLSQIIWCGAWTVTLCTIFLKLPKFRGLFEATPNDAVLLTAFFALFIFCGVFGSFNARTTRLNLLANLHKNKAFVLIILLICVVQLLLIYFGGELFRCVPLTFDELKYVLIAALTVVPIDLIRKSLVRLGNTAY